MKLPSQPYEPGSDEAIQLSAEAEAARMAMAFYESTQKLLSEAERRQKEALRLYVPTQFQERYHECRAKEALIQGGNQVGKSMAGFIEDARALLGLDPFGKYPKKNGIGVILGWDEGHISRVVHRYLLEPGIFEIFKNDEGQWQVYQPWVHEGVIDQERLEPSPPLLPEREIESIAWKSRAMNIFNRIDFKNGWTLHAFSSRSEPAQGFKANFVHIDEDIQNRGWYREVTARLTMKNGMLRWTALPHGRNDVMRNLIQRCEDEAEEEPDETNRVAVHFKATIFDNPFMTPETREANIRIWKDEGEDVYRQRALGELTTDSCMVYPSFSKYLHDAMATEPGVNISEARKIYMKCNGVPPADWMRTMIVDPGHTMCAPLFIATPPPSLGFERFVFGELVLPHCNASMFATEVERFIRFQNPFQRFIIDAHGGALTSSETGISPRAAYSRELEKFGVRCHETGSSFRSGSDDIAGRETALREWLSIQPETGAPKLFIDIARCPRLVRTLPRFMKVEAEGIIQEKANRRLECHHIEALEYGAADGLEYVAPPSGQRKTSSGERLLKAMQARQARREAMRRAPHMQHSQTISLGPVS